MQARLPERGGFFSPAFRSQVVGCTLLYWAFVYGFLTLRAAVNPQPYPAAQAALRLGSITVAIALSFALVLFALRLRRTPKAARAMAILAAAAGANVAYALVNHVIFYVLPGLWVPKYGPLNAIGSNLLEFFWLFPAWALLYIAVEHRHRRAEDARAVEEPVLWANERGAKVRVPLNLVRWLESEGDYVRLHVAGRSYLVRGTLGSVERIAAGRGFVRIHRRIVVDGRLVAKLKRQGDGRLAAVLQSGEELPIGRHYARGVRQHLSAQEPTRG